MLEGGEAVGSKLFGEGFDESALISLSDRLNGRTVYIDKNICVHAQ
jgi:hypothetical protein